MKEKIRLGRNNVMAVFPFIEPIKNKYSFLLSIFLNKIPKKIELTNGDSINVESFDFLVIILKVLTYSTSYQINNGKLELFFDTINKFTINIDKMSTSDKNIMGLLCDGLSDGANFTQNDNYLRDKTLKISTINGKKIVETKDGIKFNLEYIDAGVFSETFVSNMHRMKIVDDFRDKIVIDIGANYGDTALYYANLGAKVYAIEMDNEIYDGMIENLSLNSELKSNVEPINLTIGDENTVRNIVDKYQIKEIELLKMDCKGCEFNLVKEDLTNVNKVKIEYTTSVNNPNNDHHMENLINLLKDAHFEITVFRINPLKTHSNKTFGHIYAVRKN
jgi:hypothetical protein